MAIPKNIVVVSENQSYLVINLQEQLNAAGFDVSSVRADTEEINDLTYPISGMLLYVDEKLLSQQQALIFLKDKCLEHDIPIFMTGNSDDLQTMELLVPKELIQKEFPRPINIAELIGDLREFYKNNSKDDKKKILVVDDSGPMLRNIKSWLEDKYQVSLANSGAMAIKYLSLNRPDLILLDYEMPIIDGKQVLEMIRAEVEFATIPVIFLTGKNDKESVMNVMSLKPEGYLLKTMPPSQIVEAINTFFDKQKAML